MQKWKGEDKMMLRRVFSASLIVIMTGIFYPDFGIGARKGDVRDRMWN